MKLYSTLTSGLTLAVVVMTAPAAGQYAPYGVAPQQQPYAAQQPFVQAQQPYAPQQQPVAPRQTPYATQQAPLAPQQAYQNTAPAYGPVTAQPQQQAFGRVAFAPQAGAGVGSVAPPTETIQSPAPNQQYAAAGQVPPAASVAAYSGAPAGDCGCTNQPPAQSWEGYLPPSTGCAPQGGCATGGCATGGCATGGCGQGGFACCGSGPNFYAGGDCGYNTCDYYAGNDCCCDEGPQRQWFFGMYGLYMGRDNPGKALSTFLVDGAPAGTYYPQPGTDTFFLTSEADVDFVGGGEVRLGSTFGCATDPCGCISYQPFAWEVGYWALAEDSSFGEITDNLGGTRRMYGAIDYSGLRYDRDGSGGTFSDRPLNDYYDYQIPVDSTSTNDIRVLAVRVTQTFQVQNLELNFWRFGATAVGAGASGCVSNYGAGGGLGSGMLRKAANACGVGAAGCGGCGGYGACGCQPCGCEPCDCGPPVTPRRFFINGLAGVRYIKLDETFRNAVFFTNTTSGSDRTDYPNFMPQNGPNSDQTIFHDVETDNDLLGFQLGCSMNCLVGCKWTLFCDTNFGIYGNDIDQYQRVFSPGGGDVVFATSGADAAIRSSKTDVAFTGEARCGIGYQLSSTCRLTTAYRAVAISGVALAPSQVRTPLNEAAFGHIDSNDSIIIHGVQTGIEFKY